MRGSSIIAFVDEFGSAFLFLKEIFYYGPRTKNSFSMICEQIWKVTVQSLGTTALAGFFVGAIMTVQFTLQVKEFGALGFLGGLSTSATFREVGPLLIAFMLSGKVGAFTAAELGTMKVTEQIDAIYCLGSHPIQEIIWPRFVGIIVSSFFLLCAGLIMSLAGGMLLGLLFTGISVEEYVRHIPTIVAGPSILSGLFKSLAFAFLIALVCTYKGYRASGGAKGVGRVVVQTAVITMVGLVIMDWFTSVIGEAVMNIFLGV